MKAASAARGRVACPTPKSQINCRFSAAPSPRSEGGGAGASSGKKTRSRPTPGRPAGTRRSPTACSALWPAARDPIRARSPSAGPCFRWRVRRLPCRKSCWSVRSWPHSTLGELAGNEEPLRSPFPDRARSPDLARLPRAPHRPAVRSADPDSGWGQGRSLLHWRSRKRKTRSRSDSRSLPGPARPNPKRSPLSDADRAGGRRRQVEAEGRHALHAALERGGRGPARRDRRAPRFPGSDVAAWAAPRRKPNAGRRPSRASRPEAVGVPDRGAAADFRAARGLEARRPRPRDRGSRARHRGGGEGVPGPQPRRRLRRQRARCRSTRPGTTGARTPPR